MGIVDRREFIRLNAAALAAGSFAPAPMADEFELEVHFVGLCMFVPDKNGATMHVLMPASHGHPPDATHDAHGHHQHSENKDEFKEQVYHEHVARLVVDTAHLRPGSTRPDEVTAAFELWRHSLHIQGAPADVPTSLPGTVAAHTTPVKADVWGKDANGLLRARVSLSVGKYQTLPTARWRYRDPQPVPLTNRISWKLRGGTPHLDLALEPLDGGKRAFIQLYPLLKPSGNSLKLEVHHGPRHELPPEYPRPPIPPLGTPAHHFSGYHTLIQGAPGPVPTFESVAPASRPYTCLLSQADPE